MTYPHRRPSKLAVSSVQSRARALPEVPSYSAYHSPRFSTVDTHLMRRNDNMNTLENLVPDCFR